MQESLKNYWILGKMTSLPNKTFDIIRSLKYNTKDQIYLRLMTEDDLDQACEMEKLYFQTPWSQTSFKAELATEYSGCFVLEHNHKIIGYAVVWFIVDEFHLANIAILEKYREKGIGIWFIRNLMDLAIEKYCKYAYLEVRRSNIPAIRMYEKLGFTVFNIRKNYYTIEKEDALVMSRLLS